MTRTVSLSDPDAFVALPAPPTLEISPALRRKVVVTEFRGALRRFHADTIAWRANVAATIPRLASLMADAEATGNEEVLLACRDGLLPRLVAQSSAAIDGIRTTFGRASADVERQMKAVEATSPHLAKIGRREAVRFKRETDEQLNVLVTIHYELIALQAKHDPEARGGPSFDDAEELIASLHS